MNTVANGNTSTFFRLGSRTWGHVTVLTTLLIISVVINVGLSAKVGQLRSAIDTLKDENRLKADMPAPAIQAKKLDGEAALINYAGSNMPTILYIFSPQCHWCASNLENAKALYNGTSGKYRFLALSLSEEKLGEYVAENKIEFPVYSGLSEETRSAYKLGGTPETIVVSADGRILKTWMGTYSPNVLPEVEQYFNVRLPGLQEIKH
jgi:peroxiredoxin